MVVVSDSNHSIPIGFRFHPTKEEILISYLRPAIKREPLPADVLMKIDIYGDKKEPWNLFDKDSSDTYWIFTTLKKKSGSRIDRVAGCGCWLNQSYKKIKNSGGKMLGFDKSFTFTCKNKCRGRANNINGNWIMHEYSLAEKGLSEYVICEIKNNGAINKKRKGGHEDIDDDDGGMPITRKFVLIMTQTQTMVINSCSPQQGDGQLEFTTNGSVCLALNDINEEMNLKEASANACDWNEFSSELEDLLSVPDTNMVCANTSTTGYGEPYYGQENYQMNSYNEENDHNFGEFGHQGTKNQFMNRTQSHTNGSCPQGNPDATISLSPQGDGDEAFGQPEFDNGSVSFTVNGNEAINLEGSADACDWKNFSSELEDLLLDVPVTNMVYADECDAVTGSNIFPTTTYAVNPGYGEPCCYGQENYQMNYYDQQNNHDFGGFGHQGTNNPIFMDRTQNQTMVINSCCPQQGDGDEAFDQPEFTTNGTVSFTVNDNNEAINLEASADACDYWNKLFAELEDFSDPEELLNVLN
ncbi:No apical meristem (NAM) protein [Corchorus olitorius]|uniref:No apical meristem (NAM) protein n=1 Tax=Corchorus olitorius TaxID=93759 RepID=A0A1R3HEF3_9ROSI|nr:No apical meristem (NAM) protein [Corchorus olitorius]